MNGVPAFRGIDPYNIGTDDNSKTCSNAEGEFSDDEWKASSFEKTDKPLCSALFALNSLYGSDASQSEGEICDEDIKTNTQNRNNVKRPAGDTEYTGDNNECTENISDAPDEIIGNKTEDKAPNFYVNSNESRLANNLRKQKNNKGKIKNQPPAASEKMANSAAYRDKYFNLLEKLLRNEIKHERNYILQCIRLYCK